MAGRPHGWVLDEGHPREGTLGRALNFGSRTGSGIQKEAKGGVGVTLHPCWLLLLALPFPVGPNPGRGSWHRTESYNKFVSFVFKSPGSRMPKASGKKMFLYTSVLRAGTYPLFYYLIQNKASFYQMPLEQLHSHPEVLEPPSKHNFVDITVAWMITMSQIAFLLSDNLHPLLKIPVFGSKSEGHLYTRSPRVALFQRCYGKVVGCWGVENLLMENKTKNKQTNKKNHNKKTNADSFVAK
uniref:Uncharacterized protein n=1 Tax=Marmota marmota marmota TaxID=9994 RepID=A0A8C5ZFR5_MARMA